MDMLVIEAKIFRYYLIAIVRAASPCSDAIVVGGSAEVKVLNWGLIARQLRSGSESIHLGDDHVPAGDRALMHVRTAQLNIIGCEDTTTDHILSGHVRRIYLPLLDNGIFKLFPQLLPLAC